MTDEERMSLEVALTLNGHVVRLPGSRPFVCEWRPTRTSAACMGIATWMNPFAKRFAFACTEHAAALLDEQEGFPHVEP